MFQDHDDTHDRDWLELPTELLEHIIQNLDDESLFQLSQTCRNLHYLALPVWFKRNSIEVLANGWIDVHKPRSEHILPAVRMALFVPSLRGIRYYFNPGADRVLREFHELHRSAAWMPPVQELRLHFSVFENWMHHDIKPNVGRVQLDVDVWRGRLTGMLDQFLNKGCKALSVTGGTTICSAFTATRTAGSKFQFFKALPRFWNVKSRKSEEFTPTASGNATIQPFPSPLEFRGKEQSFEPIALEEFHLHSCILLHPQFLDWTLSMFQKSRAITILSLTTAMQPGALANLLSNITLPVLSNFKISCPLVILLRLESVDFPSIQSFLTRHPSITTLHVDSVLFPHKSATLKKPILPRLLRLAAHPNYVTWLLGPQDALPQLQKVTISSHFESYDVAFDYDLFDDAIRSVASITRQVALCIRFASTLGVEDWFRKHVAAGPKGSVISLLNGVRELKICCPYFFNCSPSTPTILSGFLALFPNLEHVHFKEHPRKLEELLLGQAFFESIASQCPTITTVKFGKSEPQEFYSSRE